MSLKKSEIKVNRFPEEISVFQEKELFLSEKRKNPEALDCFFTPGFLESSLFLYPPDLIHATYLS